MRLLTIVFGPFVSTCTSVSTQLLLALRISVCRLGHEVRVRPRYEALRAYLAEGPHATGQPFVVSERKIARRGYSERLLLLAQIPDMDS